MTTPGREKTYDRALLGERIEPAPVLQWVGFFLAPATFFVHLQIGYVLVPWSCTRHQVIWIHVVDLLAVVLAAVGVWAAWRTHAGAESAARNDDAGAVPRTRFLGVVGIGMSGLFVLLLIAQAIEAISLSPCQ
ncbi:MAG: hypothetical protein ACJ8AD_07425 [Gemmatimonadaceae bacterium]